MAIRSWLLNSRLTIRSVESIYAIKHYTHEKKKRRIKARDMDTKLGPIYIAENGSFFITRYLLNRSGMSRRFFDRSSQKGGRQTVVHIYIHTDHSWSLRRPQHPTIIEPYWYIISQRVGLRYESGSQLFPFSYKSLRSPWSQENAEIATLSAASNLKTFTNTDVGEIWVTYFEFSTTNN